MKKNNSNIMFKVHAHDMGGVNMKTELNGFNLTKTYRKKIDFSELISIYCHVRVSLQILGFFSSRFYDGKYMNNKNAQVVLT